MNLFSKIFGNKEEKDKASSLTPASDRQPVPEPLKITEISPAELKARLTQADDLIVVDLRQPWEHHTGHIPGAVNIFLQHIPVRASELPKDKDIVLQCWHGITSLDVAGYLLQNGWSAGRVSSLSGGMAGWVQAYGSEGLEKS